MNPKLHQAKQFIRHYFRAKRNGHGIHSPFAYQLCEEVFYNHNSFYAFDKLQLLRKQLLLDQRELEIKDFGAGSRTFMGNKRKIAEIARKGNSSKAQSELMFRLVNFLQSQYILELGTSLGLNTLYLASANPKAKVISIEGDEGLLDFAKKLAQHAEIKNIEFINGHFDTALPELLEKTNRLDFLYVDGNHTYEATKKYFEVSLEKVGEEGVIVFDDIYWSEGMTKAWREIKKHPEVSLSIDAFYFGMVFFRSEMKEKVELDLYL